MAVLSKAAILGADDRDTLDIPVPAWGGSVRIRKMSAYHAEKLAGAIMQAGDGLDGLLAARAVAWSVVDEAGNLVFSDTETDLKELAEKNAKVLDALFKRINEFNADQITIEEEAKNS